MLLVTKAGQETKGCYALALLFLIPTHIPLTRINHRLEKCGREGGILLVHYFCHTFIQVQLFFTGIDSNAT